MLHLFGVDDGEVIGRPGALVVLQPVGEGLGEAADDVGCGSRSFWRAYQGPSNAAAAQRGRPGRGGT